MAITYSWHILQLDAKIEQDDKANIVHTVHYIYRGVKDDDETISFDVHNSIGLQAPSGDEFIEYGDLTKENVVSWIEPNVDVENMQNIIIENINLKENPTDTYLQPNWE